jgi:serine protease Do
MRARICTLFTFLVLVLPAHADPAIPTPPPAVNKSVPESLDELKAIQAQTRAVLEKAIPCTVGLQVGGASGSGVIINKEGMILTAGHVSEKPDRPVDIILHDGRIIKGKTLGANRSADWDRSVKDSGLIQITEKGDWPYLEMGKSSDLKAGNWCIAIGHPNGYHKGRTPVVRVGKILKINETTITTDCTIVGGDSGGPLFDLQGKVIGIHSRIEPDLLPSLSLKLNHHVPVDTYRDNWDKLVKGETWGTRFTQPKMNVMKAYLGVSPMENTKDAKIASITEDSPAAKAGLKAGDLITKFDGKDIKTYEEFVDLLNKKKPNDEIAVEVKRGDKVEVIKVKLGGRR